MKTSSIRSTAHPIGATLPATVTRTVPFGVVVRLAPGVEGLVHRSELREGTLRERGRGTGHPARHGPPAPPHQPRPGRLSGPRPGPPGARASPGPGDTSGDHHRSPVQWGLWADHHSPCPYCRVSPGDLHGPPGAHR
ncbi:S1 RNA-binding domain-containing protein [Streptomyces sp. Sge12]|uniref:S1 RNA-binding domain-containing protein n=1 Tax=Streptomyces sp. Sge12 TaxID=1972846 RepID=UPI000D1A79C3